MTDGARVLVLGGGPGGYTAAFRAADLGCRVTLVERYPALGGVCLNVGCIPSKALLHLAAVTREAQELDRHGIIFGKPEIQPRRIAAFKNDLVGRLGGGLASLARARTIQVIQDTAAFVSPRQVRLGGGRTLDFDRAIIATGSANTAPPGLPDSHPRLLDSTAALRFDTLPQRLLIIGGGVIGLEMACLFEGMGARVCIVESEPQLLGECDDDLVAPLRKRLEASCDGVFTGTRVRRVEAAGEDGLNVLFERRGEGKAAPADVSGGVSAGAPADAPADEPTDEHFDAVLVATGRKPNTGAIGLEHAGVATNPRGFIETDDGQRTNVPSIYAVGDVTGPPMLAHKAAHQGKVAAENAAGRESAFDKRAVPSVVYTAPEIAWAGLTEKHARQHNVDYKKAVFPWQASGRALGAGHADGLTKLLYSVRDKTLLGAGICGHGAGDLIAEAVLAIEMGADVGDIALAVHPHPTYAETVGLAAELADGVITDLYQPKPR